MEMLSKQRVSAYGDRKDAVDCFNKGDFVFYSHRGVGIVGAGRIKDGRVKEESHPVFRVEKYLEVEFLVPVPHSFETLRSMSFGGVTDFLGHGFFWARIDKRPYLSKQESESLLEELRRVLDLEYPEA